MKNFITITVLSLALVVVAFLVGRSSSKPVVEEPASVPLSSETVAPTKRGTELGDLAPDFQLTRLDGSTLSLADLRDQPAVLVFWAAWCPFCKEEVPQVNKLAGAYESRGVRVLGINVRDSQARTEWGVKDFGIRYSVVRDANGDAARDYNVKGIPTVLLLDRKGVVRYAGSHIAKDYAARLDLMLAEQN